ncbi:MAG: hypothetical protein KC546_14600 [Anaerolineae bacterium]|nr:hypothetical protein [Anaerolineae bacterium]
MNPAFLLNGLPIYREAGSASTGFTHNYYPIDNLTSVSDVHGYYHPNVY